MRVLGACGPAGAGSEKLLTGDRTAFPQNSNTTQAPWLPKQAVTILDNRNLLEEFLQAQTSSVAHTDAGGTYHCETYPQVSKLGRQWLQQTEMAQPEKLWQPKFQVLCKNQLPTSVLWNLIK